MFSCPSFKILMIYNQVYVQSWSKVTKKHDLSPKGWLHQSKPRSMLFRAAKKVFRDSSWDNWIRIKNPISITQDGYLFLIGTQIDTL